MNLCCLFPGYLIKQLSFRKNLSSLWSFFSDNLFFTDKSFHRKTAFHRKTVSGSYIRNGMKVGELWCGWWSLYLLILNTQFLDTRSTQQPLYYKKADGCFLTFVCVKFLLHQCWKWILKAEVRIYWSTEFLVFPHLLLLQSQFCIDLFPINKCSVSKDNFQTRKI